MFISKVSELLIRYPAAPVDGYAIFCAAEAFARYSQRSREQVLQDAVVDAKAASFLLKLAEEFV